MKIQGSKNLEFLLDNFDWQKSRQQVKQGFILEGGSGSGKSYDVIHFLMYYCQQNKGRGKDILIFRETLADLKKTIYKDFQKVLNLYGLYDPNMDTLSPPLHYNLFGNVIYFSGLDTMGAHGERHDIIWGNEGMEINRDAFKQLNQRCNECFIIDYNPSNTEHWIFDELWNRPDTKHCLSTCLDNPFLPQGQRSEILSYEPTPENIKNGTADDYLWNVYGLGLRSAPQGLVFQYVTWIDKLPDLTSIYYGLDFGSVHPTTLVRGGRVGKNAYYEKVFCEPVDSPDRICELILRAGLTKGTVIWADSENAGNISYMRRQGFMILPVSKPAGSVMYGIGLMKNHKIHIVDCPEWRKEQTGYKMRTVNGIKLNEPVKANDDLWDAARYLSMANFV